MRIWLLPLAALLVVVGLWFVFREMPTDAGTPYAPDGAGAGSQPGPAAPAPEDGEAPGGAPVPPDPRPEESRPGDLGPGEQPMTEQFERGALPKVALQEPMELGSRERPRELYVDTRVLVELDARVGSGRTGRPPVAGARLVAESGAQRRWQLPEGTTARMAHAALTPSEQAGHSVVLHGAPASNSPGEIPVGLLRVKFPPDWVLQDVQRFAELHDLEGLRKLTIEPNWYSFAAASGPAALEKAQSLRGNEDVLAAEPDWWRPLRIR